MGTYLGKAGETSIKDTKIWSFSPFHSLSFSSKFATHGFLIFFSFSFTEM